MSANQAALLEAWATLGAATFAAAAVAISWRTRVSERQQRSEQVSEAKQAQAARVSSWINSTGSIVVRNDSGVAVYKVQARFFYGDQLLGELAERPIVPPEESPKTLTMPPEIQSVFYKLNTGNSLEYILVELWFTDANNRDWVRRSNGRLEPQPWGRGRGVSDSASE